MDFDPGDPRNNLFRAPPASTTPRAYSGDGSIKGSVFAPSSGFADPDTVRGNSVSMSADTDFLDNPFRPSNSVFEPALGLTSLTSYGTTILMTEILQTILMTLIALSESRRLIGSLIF